MENMTRYSILAGIYFPAITTCRYCEEEYYDYELDTDGYCDQCWDVQGRIVTLNEVL